MPKGFEWVAVDVTNDEQLQEVYTLLTENYVEDDDNMFRWHSVIVDAGAYLLNGVLDSITPESFCVGL